MLRFTLTAPVLLAIFFTATPAQQPKLPNGVTVTRNLEYGPHERNKLDVYIPPGHGPFPLVIWVHGGAWQAGSKDSGGPALQMLEHGYAVAAINYRLSQHAIYPAQIEDCKAAVRYLRKHAEKYRLNPDAFGVWGASAGGHLVALLGTTGDSQDFDGYGHVKTGSSQVQAVCDWFGPIDFTKMNEQSQGQGKIDHDSPTAPEAKLIGGPVQTNKEKVLRANPITFVTKGDAPFLIIHGDQDPLVPHGQSELLIQALKKANISAELIVLKGAGHGGKEFSTTEQKAKITAFFDQYLKKK